MLHINFKPTSYDNELLVNQGGKSQGEKTKGLGHERYQNDDQEAQIAGYGQELGKTLKFIRRLQ